MGFLQNLTDNQTAILGCAVVLFAAFMVMSLSARLGSAAGSARPDSDRSAPVTRLQAPAHEQRRRAA